jgi:hypothetical protein
MPKEFDKITIGALAEAFDKDFLTIKRWIDANDDRLTSEKAIDVYRSMAAIHKSAPRKTA